MPISNFKSVEAIVNGKKLRGIYRRETGTFSVQKGAVSITATEYEYAFDFTAGGKRYRSIFGKESNYGKLGATGKWESTAVESAAEALLRFRTNAETGDGPTSIKEELELSRQLATEQKRKEAKEKTVEELVELFLEDIAISAPGIKSNKPRTVKEYSLNLYRDVVPAIGKRKAKDIEREDITDIIESIVKRKKIVQANRTLAACSRLFNWAVSKGRVRFNPCAQMKKYEERPRERVLTEPEQKEQNTNLARHSEIKALWEKLNEAKNLPEARILMLCILTGARPGEICKMKWEDIKDNWWTVHKTEIKTEVELECYLTPTALKVLGPLGTSGYVFPMTNNKEKPIPVNRISKFVRDNKNFKLPPWQPRDLRRTFTTLAKGFGFSDLIVNKAQARKDSSIIRVHYDKRRYYSELRQLFEAVEKEINRITGQPAKTAKIISINK